MLKVTITTVAGVGQTPVSAVLCDSPDPLPRHDLTVNGQPVLQLADLFRATFGKVFDRKNRRPRIGFKVTRDTDEAGAKFATDFAATLFALDHVCLDCPTSGDVTLEIGDGTGSVTRYLRGAGLEQIGMARQRGRTLEFQYAIVGGVYSKT